MNSVEQKRRRERKRQTKQNEGQETENLQQEALKNGQQKFTKTGETFKRFKFKSGPVNCTYNGLDDLIWPSNLQ